MEYIRIGKIVNTHGIKGELKIENHSDFLDERYAKDSFVYIGEDHIKEMVKSYRVHKGFVLLTLNGKENINLVEQYKTLNIYKAQEDIKPLENGYYFKDLKDLDVYQNNIKVGVVIGVDEGVKTNFIRIQKEDGKQTLVPFLDKFILNVDLNERKIEIVEMEGLL